MEILQIKNLNFRYPEEECEAIKDVSFSVQEGEFIVLCGESGCGKSTLLKLLKRELSTYGEKSGEIIYSGIAQEELEDRKAAAEIGFVLQNPESQIVTDKVWHELAFGMESLGYSTSDIRRRVAEMASYFGIEDWFHKDTAKLSGGQKQMLNLASVMVMQPKVLLLDEPTAQLDPIAASNFIGTLQKLNRELGLTIILVEHRLEEAFPISDKVLLMERGKLIYSDSPRKMISFLKSNSNHRVLQGLPTAMRIYEALAYSEDRDLEKSANMIMDKAMNNDMNNDRTKVDEYLCPLTVKEGRDFITANFDNKIDKLVERSNEKKEKVVLELKNVSFRYEKDLPDILKNVSFSVYEGENFCILGGNGTGKTTTLGIMSGLLRAYSGKVIINGQKLGKQSDKALYRNNITMLPQNPQTVFIGNTVEEDFFEICRAMEYKKEEVKERILEMAEKFEIVYLLNKHPYDLSGGEQQKAALAKIFLLQPKILLLDEPTKGIDAYYKQTLSKIMKNLKANGITIIMVTHDVEFAAENADRCAMFFDGELVSVDTPVEFFADNNFYTTAANRISRGYYKKAILCEDVIALCKANERKSG